MSKAHKQISRGKQIDKFGKKLAKAYLKKPRSRLYTDAERKLRSSLMAKKRARIKKLENMSPVEYVLLNKRTMQSIQGSLGQGKFRKELYYDGYLDDPDYSDRDFREWMIENGDDDLLDRTLAVANVKEPVDAKIQRDPQYELSVDTLESRQRATIENEISDIDAQLSKINTNAQNRKNREMLKYLDKKYRLQNGNGLLEALSRGEVVYNTLSNPEKAAIDYLKQTLATEIIESLDLEALGKDKAGIAKDAIYNGIMSNPIQGLKAALRGNAVLSVTKKYGNNAGELAGGMMDFMTSAIEGNVSANSLAGSLLSYTINSTGLNKSLMMEAAEELVNSGESTNQKENAKMFTRDVLVDIAKDVITSGFNLTTALPRIVKDLVVDAGQYAIRDVKATEKDTKKAEAKKKAQEKNKEVEEKVKKENDGKSIGELTEEEQNEVLSKFLM